VTLSGCSNAPAASPPRIVEVVKPAPVPAACRQLRPLVLPDGTTAQQVIEAQQAVILSYEQQVRACAK
jgi:hypothetical protein